MKSFFAIALTFIFGSLAGSLFGLNPVATGTGATVASVAVASKMPSGALTANGFDLTDINTQLGAYFRKYDQQIYRQIFKSLQFENYMTPIPGVKSQYVAPQTTVTDVLQPHQKAWTPKGEVAFDARINTVNKIKFDIQVDELETLYDSWLAWLAQEEKSYKEWPFVKWIVYNEFMPKMIDNLEDISVNGDVAAVTPGTAGGHLDTTDGILTILADEITATNLTAVTVGALSPSTMVDKVETFVDGISPAEKKALGKAPIFMSTSNAELYARDYRNTYGGNMDYTPEKGMKVDGTNLTIVGIDAMNGSNRFLATPKWNMIKMFDNVMMPGGRINVELDKRVLNIYGNFKRGYGFRRLDHVFCSDNA